MYNSEIEVSPVFNVITENLLPKIFKTPNPFTFTIDIGPVHLHPRNIPNFGTVIGFASEVIAEQERQRCIQLIREAPYLFDLMPLGQTFFTYLAALDHLEKLFPNFERGSAFTRRGYVVHDQYTLDYAGLLGPESYYISIY